MQRATKWNTQPDIASGCADISYRWESEQRAQLIVLMHFSRVVDGSRMDLELAFPSPLAVMWETESFGLIDSPVELPKLSGPRFGGWTFPTILVENSAWAERYAARKYSANDINALHIKHYFLVSLNDLLHVLAEGTPRSKWVEAVDA